MLRQMTPIAGGVALVVAVGVLATGTPLQSEVRILAVQDFSLAADIVDEIPTKRAEPIAKPPPPVDLTPKVGSRGPEILAIEQRLADLRYMAGKVDGIFDRATAHGLTAFQKVEGLPRSGRGDATTVARLSSASIPSPRYTSPANHLEVDIPRQVVFVVRDGVVAWVLPTSTGNNKMFTNQGYTRRAITPNGVFKVSRKINAMRISPLGELYKPSYFNGGIAFHGNGSVPVYPASHGCVRLPMQFADWFFVNAAPIGQVVYVYGGPIGENPQPFIDDRPAQSPSPTPSPSPSPSPSPPPTAPSTSTAT